jgi:hypothetical protein
MHHIQEPPLRRQKASRTAHARNHYSVCPHQLPSPPSPLPHLSNLTSPRRLARSTDPITLLVGPSEAAFTVPKLLLSYHSTEFDRAIYGSQKTQPTVALADSEPREIELFVTWLTTGCIPWKRLTGDPELENLWVLGKLLGAPSFCNSVMYLIFTDYDWWSLNAEMAGYAFEHTTPSDKLRLFMVDLIRSNGPFSEKSNLSSEEKARWVELLAKGGEVFGRGGFR